MSADVICGDALTVLRTLPAESAQMCVTSPPYWGLRDYGVDGQLGLEKTPDEYVANMVAVFREVRRVLRDDGTLWLNLGDSYVGGGRGGGAENCKQRTNVGSLDAAPNVRVHGLKPKDLVGIPWMLAFALRADGWYLRSDIIWSKPNPMPESVNDRPTKAHEYLFLFSKRQQYFYDAAAIMEEVSPNTHMRVSQDVAAQIGSLRANGGTRPTRPMKAVVRRKIAEPGRGIKNNTSFAEAVCLPVLRRNARTVWTVATRPYSEAHFATFPPKLIEPCILAGSRPGDTVLDPFGGAGTTALVADRLGRDALLIDLNPAYVAMAERRLHADAGMFADVQALAQ